MKDEAEKKTEAERNQGGAKKFIVVGGKGRRRIVEVVEREGQNV